MRLFVILLLCLPWITLTHAEDRMRVATPTPTTGSNSSAGRPTADDDKRKTASTEPSRTYNENQSGVLQSKPATAEFTSFSNRCVRQGDLISFSGHNLTALAGDSLAIKVDHGYLSLKKISISPNQLIVQLPTDNRIQHNHRYAVMLQGKPNSSSNEKTALTITTCHLNSRDSELENQPEREYGQLVLLIKTVAAPLIEQQLQQLGFPILQQHTLTGLERVLITIKVTDATLSDTMIDLQSRFPDAVIDMNSHYQPAARPRVYAPEMIAWPNSSQPCKSMSKLTIGLIDGMIDQTHPALSHQAITVNNFLNPSEQFEQQHGTAIAVILAGDKKDDGYQGLLTGITILGASVLQQRQDNLIATTESIVRAVDWLLIEHVRLVNVSLSGSKANAVLKTVFGTAINKGMIIFSATGNNGKTASPSYPAALEGVIAITAIDAAQRIYTEANQGDYIDFSAPGVDIWTIENGLQGKYRSGTSFASPYGLAVAALYLNKNPSLSRAVLYNALKASALDLGDKGQDKKFGWGLVQAPQKVCTMQ